MPSRRRAKQDRSMMNDFGTMAVMTAVLVYIIDLSGFTDAWRGALARLLKVRELRALPPFDCSRCAVWWACLLYALLVGRLTWWAVGFAALLSLLSGPIGGALDLLRVWITELICKLYPKSK